MKIQNIPREIKNGIIHSKKEEFYKECHFRNRNASFACPQCYLGLVQITLRRLNHSKWDKVDCSDLYARIFDEDTSRHHNCIDRNNAIMQIFELISKRSCRI